MLHSPNYRESCPGILEIAHRRVPIQRIPNLLLNWSNSAANYGIHYRKVQVLNKYITQYPGRRQYRRNQSINMAMFTLTTRNTLPMCPKWHADFYNRRLVNRPKWLKDRKDRAFRF